MIEFAVLNRHAQREISNPMNDKITARIPAELNAAFEEFLASAPECIRTRQDAIRHILADWLTTKGFIGAQAEMPRRAAARIRAMGDGNQAVVTRSRLDDGANKVTELAGDGQAR